jgi:hypothetical protein
MHKPSSERPRGVSLAAYALAGALALGELGVLAVALSPDVSADYRAYYVDQSTTCLPRAASGAAIFAATVRLLPGEPVLDALVGCGWQGPAGNGLHSVGTRSQLHLRVPPGQSLQVELEMVASNETAPRQRVRASADGIAMGEGAVAGPEPVRLALAVPRAASRDGYVVVQLDLPDAFLPYAIAPEIDRRAVRLLAVGLHPLPSPEPATQPPEPDVDEPAAAAQPAAVPAHRAI